MAKRGRWRTLTSVRRYEKSGKALRLLALLGKACQERCAVAEQELEFALEGREAVWMFGAGAEGLAARQV